MKCDGDHPSPMDDATVYAYLNRRGTLEKWCKGCYRTSTDAEYVITREEYEVALVMME